MWREAPDLGIGLSSLLPEHLTALLLGPRRAVTKQLFDLLPVHEMPPSPPGRSADGFSGGATSISEST